MNRGEEEQEPNHDNTYANRDLIDFDPDEGLLSGTAINGTSDIPGPHAQGEDKAEDAYSADGDDRADSRQGAEDS